ncbi:hypothetical protein QQ056_14790 [Oscillatoria laete-virens NRMC-F 0139]|nr:hypothetical protein [Oscillatoria laete-virens]MDL5054804.1 hypothetical protein [Oscillatoria laete-virens NRMC-F 0139]
MPTAGLEVLKQLLQFDPGLPTDWLMQEHATKVALALMLQIVRNQFDPGTIRAVAEQGDHPIHALRFAPYNENRVRMSWNEQERRLAARMLTAEKNLDEAKQEKRASDRKFEQAENRLTEVEAESALMRMMLTLKAFQQCVEPLLERGPLVTVMLALFGEAALTKNAATQEVREKTKRAYEVLARRIDDDEFRINLGRALRNWICEYDDQAGPDGRLSAAAAAELAERWMANSEAFEKFNEVLQDKPVRNVDHGSDGAAIGASLEEADAVLDDGSSFVDEDVDDEFEDLPF